MVGLLVCSVWVWAIAVDKIILFTRTSRAMDRFEQAFLVGAIAGGTLPQHIVAAPTTPWRAAVRRRHARMEAQPGGPGAVVRRVLQMRIEKVMDVTITRGGRTARKPAPGAGDGRLGRPLHRPCFGTVLGHHDELPVDRGRRRTPPWR